MVYLLGLSDLCYERASMLDKDRDRKATDEYKLHAASEIPVCLFYPFATSLWASHLPNTQLFCLKSLIICAWSSTGGRYRWLLSKLRPSRGLPNSSQSCQTATDTAIYELLHPTSGGLHAEETALQLPTSSSLYFTASQLMHPVFGGVQNTNMMLGKPTCRRWQSGVKLVIDTSDSCLACSRDDIVVLPSGEQGLVEYKCPCKAAKKNLTPEKAAVKCRDFCSVLNISGQLELKKTQAYFYQVQAFPSNYSERVVPLRDLDTKRPTLTNSPCRPLFLDTCSPSNHRVLQSRCLPRTCPASL